MLLSALLCSCLSVPSYSLSDSQILEEEDLYMPACYEWTELKEGLFFTRFRSSRFPVSYIIARVDLRLPEIALVCYPMPEDVRDGLVRRIPLSDFSAKTGADVSFNMSPFESVTASRTKIAGVHKVLDDVLYAPVPGYAALAFDSGPDGYTAAILDGQDPEMTVRHDYAFGGFFVILQDGEEVEFARHSYDSRLAVGIADGGRTLFILAAEGEFPEQSRGLSFAQCARILKKAGCTDALEMDGGTSCAMRLGKKSALSYSTYRKTPSCMGFVMGQ